MLALWPLTASTYYAHRVATLSKHLAFGDGLHELPQADQGEKHRGSLERAPAKVRSAYALLNRFRSVSNTLHISDRLSIPTVHDLDLSGQIYS